MDKNSQSETCGCWREGNSWTATSERNVSETAPCIIEQCKVNIHLGLGLPEAAHSCPIQSPRPTLTLRSEGTPRIILSALQESLNPVLENPYRLPPQAVVASAVKSSSPSRHSGRESGVWSSKTSQSRFSQLTPHCNNQRPTSWAPWRLHRRKQGRRTLWRCNKKPRRPKSGNVLLFSAPPEKSAENDDFPSVSTTWPLGSKFLNLFKA